jgi:hypothetical protein
LLSNRRLALRNRSDVMTRARTASLALAAVAALATSSCRGATALHFVVCLDFDPAALPVRTVRVKINNASGVSLTGSAGQEVTITDASQFPLRFSVFASGNQSEALTVSVEALTNMRPMGMGATPSDIIARINTSFVAGEVRTVPVLLERSCAGVLCGPDQTCRSGGCATAMVTSDTYASGATCGASDGGVEAGASDAGSCPADLTVDLRLGADITRVTHLAIGQRANGPAGSLRVAAIATSMASANLIVGDVRLAGGALVADGAITSSALDSAGRSLSWTRTSVVAATQSRVYHGTTGTGLSALSAWDSQVGTGPIAGTHPGMDMNELQICTFVGAQLTCRAYSEATGVLVASAMAPPPINTSLTDATFVSMSTFGGTTPLMAAFRTSTAVGRCVLIDTAMNPPSCQPVALPPFTSATAALTANADLAIAFVSSSMLQAAIAPAVGASPQWINLGAIAADAAIATASAAGQQLVVATMATGVALHRVAQNRAGPPTLVPTTTTGPQTIAALPVAQNIAGVGERFVIAYPSANNVVELRLISTSACR